MTVMQKKKFFDNQTICLPHQTKVLEVRGDPVNEEKTLSYKRHGNLMSLQGLSGIICCFVIVSSHRNSNCWISSSL